MSSFWKKYQSIPVVYKMKKIINEIFRVGVVGLASILFLAGGMTLTTAVSNAAQPNIVDRPIKWTQNRTNLIREYAKMHYGKDITTITPQAVVVHWTASESCDGTYNYFYGETMPDDGGGTLNVASHFLVDKDGTIYRLTPENALNRHAIGYNWCAIGIENVGGSDGEQNLTDAQAQANIKLIRYLKAKYHTINYVWGHYQQNEAKASGLFIEHVPDYWADKIDPGEIFMGKLKAGLAGDGLKFY
jgi:N-acetyl-anhydromuramyl-L-alanine amidase AmpD